MTISAAALLAGRNLAGFFFPVNVTRYNSSVIRCTRKHSSFERWQKTLSSLFLIKNAKGHSDFAVVINAAADRFFSPYLELCSDRSMHVFLTQIHNTQ